MASILGEIKRRKVFQVAVAYLVVAWVLVQVITSIEEPLRLPAWSDSFVIVLLFLGFPVAVLLSWAFDVKYQGLVSTEDTKLGDGTTTVPPDAASSISAGPAIAVLPFANMSGDPDNVYFSDGISEEILNGLASLPGLKVIARTSSFQFRDSRDVRDIAKTLGVTHLLEGSVRKVGNMVRIVAQLIDGRDGGHVWSDGYNRELDDIFTVQDEIAASILQKLEGTFTEEAPTHATEVNPKTFDLYLRGMHEVNKHTPDGFEAGLAYLNQAIDNDPTDPLAYAGLAYVYVVLGHDPRPPPQALPRAKAAALKSLELGGDLAEAHLTLAQVSMYYDWDMHAAERYFKRVFELNPNLATAHGHYAWFLMQRGDQEEAVAAQMKAQSLDPLSPVYTAWVAWKFNWLGRYDDAIAEAKRSLELFPDFPMGHYVLGSAFAKKGMYEESIAAHKKAGQASPGWRWGLGVTYALAGREKEARDLLAELEADVYDWDTWGLAEIYATLGDKDGAFRWLEEAYRQRHSYIPWLTRFPEFEPLRDDARFYALVNKSRPS